MPAAPGGGRHQGRLVQGSVATAAEGSTAPAGTSTPEARLCPPTPTKPKRPSNSNTPTTTSITISQMTIHSSRVLCELFRWSRSMSSISCTHKDLYGDSAHKEGRKHQARGPAHKRGGGGHHARLAQHTNGVWGGGHQARGSAHKRGGGWGAPGQQD
eukprot:315937-Chlamydomonas_euryale.AAC.4